MSLGEHPRFSPIVPGQLGHEHWQKRIHLGIALGLLGQSPSRPCPAAIGTALVQRSF